MQVKLNKNQKLILSAVLISLSALVSCASINRAQPVPLEVEHGFVLQDSNVVNLSQNKGQLRSLTIATDDNLPTTFKFIAVKLGSYSANFTLQQNQNSALSVSQLAADKDAFLAVNGGFFTPSFTPDGLFVAHGQQLSAYSKQPIFSALVRINHDGQIELGASGSNYQPDNYAIQAGPLMIDNGQMLVSRVNQFNQFATRTVLAESSNNQLLVISTSSISLYTLENILYQHPQWFGVSKIKIAVNLDGGRSSAIYVDDQQVHERLNGKNKVQNVLMFF